MTSIRLLLALLMLTPACAAPASAQAQAGRIDIGSLRQVRDGLWVIEDRHYTPAVPNVGIVTGTKAVLVVDTGIDRRAGDAILAVARRIANGRTIYATATHFLPEHGFGLAAFKGKATIVYNEAQRTEFVEKRSNYVQLFTQLGMGALVGDEHFVTPDRVYSRHLWLDLGGRVVDLYSGHNGHTRGDQLIWIPDLRALFMGDLLETASFPIMPWYPAIHDTDVSPAKWLATLTWAAALNPVIVVPGHGPIGTRNDLVNLARYISGARADVRSLCGTARSADALADALEPKLKREHTDWHLAEWVRPNIPAFVRDYCPALHR